MPTAEQLRRVAQVVGDMQRAQERQLRAGEITQAEYQEELKHCDLIRRRMISNFGMAALADRHGGWLAEDQARALLHPVFQDNPTVDVYWSTGILGAQNSFKTR